MDEGVGIYNGDLVITPELKVYHNKLLIFSMQLQANSV